MSNFNEINSWNQFNKPFNDLHTSTNNTSLPKEKNQDDPEQKPITNIAMNTLNNLEPTNSGIKRSARQSDLKGNKKEDKIKRNLFNTPNSPLATEAKNPSIRKNLFTSFNSSQTENTAQEINRNLFNSQCFEFSFGNEARTRAEHVEKNPNKKNESISEVNSQEIKGANSLSNNSFDIQPLSETNNPRREIPWENKNPTIFDGSITINNVNYPIEKIGNGKNHIVYRFTESANITIGNQILSTDEIVLKVLNPTVVTHPTKKRRMHDGTKRGYEHLIKNGIPTPKVFVDPMTFTDTHNKKNGGFWLIEKCPYKISGEEWNLAQTFDALDEKTQKLLLWVKKFLTNTALNKEEIINDFRKDNVMFDHSHTPKIIDFSPPETCKWDINYHLFVYLKDWACGNKNIFEFLTSDFPQEMKEGLRESFANEQITSNK